jgi:Spy/CpxP family protein refolding chaperone
MNHWTALAVLAGMLAGVSLSRAAETADGQKSKAPRPAQGQAVGVRRERAQALAKELNLTEDQKTQVTAVLKKQAEKVRALRADTSLTPQQRREKARALQAEVAPEMKKILTAEQMEKWQKIRSEQAAKRRAAANGAAREAKPAN